MPSRYRVDDEDESDGNESDTVCACCQKREPEGCDEEPVFWVDCEVCEIWYHIYIVHLEGTLLLSLADTCEDVSNNLVRTTNHFDPSFMLP